jgi:excisionase family DNA binding protein
MNSQIVARPGKGRKPPSPSTPTPTPPATLTRISTEEAAALLGMHRTTLYGMAKRGQLPHQPLGEGRCIFYREWLLDWLEMRRVAGLENGS